MVIRSAQSLSRSLLFIFNFSSRLFSTCAFTYAKSLSKKTQRDINEQDTITYSHLQVMDACNWAAVHYISFWLLLLFVRCLNARPKLSTFFSFNCRQVGCLSSVQHQTQRENWNRNGVINQYYISHIQRIRTFYCIIIWQFFVRFIAVTKIFPLEGRKFFFHRCIRAVQWIAHGTLLPKTKWCPSNLWPLWRTSATAVGLSLAVKSQNCINRKTIFRQDQKTIKTRAYQMRMLECAYENTFCANSGPVHLVGVWCE